MVKKLDPYVKVLLGIVAAVGTWALFSWIHFMIQEWLESIGVVSEGAQYLFMVLIAAVILVGFYGFRGGFKRLAKNF